MIEKQWQAMYDAAYGDLENERTVIVSTRYGGAYEGGRFAAMTLSDLTSDESEAFGGDNACANWWEDNRHRVGVGSTPNEALADWYSKRVVATVKQTET